MNYYQINETAARTAHDMNSFYTFTEGKATAEYKSQVDAAASMAAEKKTLVDPIHHGKIDALLNAYAWSFGAIRAYPVENQG